MVDDGPPVLLTPLPHPLQEFFAANLVSVDTLLGQCFFHGILRCDTGVVRAGNPASLITLHPFPTDEYILNRVVEHVAHGQDAGDVRRRDDDSERLLLFVDRRAELTIRFPEFIPLVFYVFGIIDFWKFQGFYRLTLYRFTLSKQKGSRRATLGISQTGDSRIYIVMAVLKRKGMRTAFWPKNLWRAASTFNETSESKENLNPAPIAPNPSVEEEEVLIIGLGMNSSLAR